MMEYKYEVYEDNGGGLSLCVMDGDAGIAIYCVAGPSVLLDAASQLRKDPEAWVSWDGEFHDVAGISEDVPTSVLYGDLYGDLVAWMTAGDEAWEHIPAERMGFAARIALGLE